MKVLIRHKFSVTIAQEGREGERETEEEKKRKKNRGREERKK